MNDIEIVDIRVKIIEPLLKIQETLDKNIKSLKVIIQKEGANDIRIKSLEDILIEIIVSVGFLFGAINIATNDYFSEFKKLMDTTASQLRAQEKMANYIRLPMSVMTQFKIEHLFAVLLKKINKFPKKESFYKYIKTLKDEAERSDEEMKVFETLNHMRNCFHNGGKHNKDDFYHTINGLDFHFIKGEKIQYYSITHVLVVLGKSIELVCELLHKEPFVSITKEIADIPD